MVSVFPGVELVFAISLLWTRVLISEDFPTLLRPTNAITGRLSAGRDSAPVTQAVNIAAVTFIAILRPAISFRFGAISGPRDIRWET